MDIGRNSWALTLTVIPLFVFLLAPVVLVFPLSFSNDQYIVFPPQNWGTRYYEALFANGPLIAAFGTSLAVGLVVTVLSLAIALPAAYALVRLDFAGRDALMGLFTAPLLLPTIVLGLAILLVFVRVDLLATYQGLVLGHMVLTLPYALRILATSLSTLPGSVEDAAATLGAPPFTVFRRVTLPLVRPGLMAAGALCFLVSFDEVVISLFIVGPRLSTFPVEMYRYVESRNDPLIAAASVILILATLVFVVVVERSIGVTRALGAKKA
jgi:putative spermidine/putrescine transport system permease protein